MNVLVVSSIYPRLGDQNWGIFIKRRVNEMSEFCNQTIIVCLSLYHPSWRIIREPKKINLHSLRYVKFPKTVLHFTEGFFLLMSLLFKVLFSGLKFDVIHADFAYPTGFAAVLVSKILKKPVVVMAHGSDINILTKRGVILRKMISWTVRNSNYVIAVSTKLRDKMIKLGAYPERISVIPCGVDFSKFKPEDKKKCRKKLSLPLNGNILLFVGNLYPVKGLTYLLDSLSEVLKKNNDFTLFLVGEGFLKNKLIKKAERLGIKEHVHFAGRQPPSEIPLWMNACDVFILPSKSEGTPLVVLEAIACGKPIIATGVGGIPEFVSEKNGILVEPKNVAQLRDAILQLVGDEKMRTEFGKNSLHVRETKVLDWVSHAKKIYSIYLKLTDHEHTNTR